MIPSGALGLSLFVGVIAAAPARAQAATISSPAPGYPLSNTQTLAAKSSLGDLRAAVMAGDDVELRAWVVSSMSVPRLTGVILRRADGHWQAWAATEVKCAPSVPRGTLDAASAPVRGTPVPALECCGFCEQWRSLVRTP
jgi:hypothetical protein